MDTSLPWEKKKAPEAVAAQAQLNSQIVLARATMTSALLGQKLWTSDADPEQRAKWIVEAMADAHVILENSINWDERLKKELKQ